jgi:hypothetical protein
VHGLLREREVRGVRERKRIQREHGRSEPGDAACERERALRRRRRDVSNRSFALYFVPERREAVRKVRERVLVVREVVPVVQSAPPDLGQAGRLGARADRRQTHSRGDGAVNRVLLARGLLLLFCYLFFFFGDGKNAFGRKRGVSG